MGNNIAKNEDGKILNRYKNKGYNFIETLGVNYKGGFKDISVETPIIIDLLQEGISFNNLMYEKVIPFENILNISLQSKQYIENQVSLGKLMFFGILAFGMNKNQKKFNDEFIVLNLKDNNENYNVLIQANEYTNNQSIYDKIVKYRSK
jgi:hypothetical protein